MRITVMTVFCVLSVLNGYSQNEEKKWYFGNTAGIDFTSGAPVAITNSGMNAIDNTASVSDSAGNILFYCDGIQVYNRNHQVMPNGSGLLGSKSGGHAATAVKQPCSETIYYLFTMDTYAGNKGLRYNIIDMSLNGGLGDIVAGQKNIVLINPASEQILPVVHANKMEIWLITHPWNSSSFNTYKITSAGLNTTPVVSTVGAMRNGITENALGQISINPANNKVVTVTWGSDRWELFDFDNTTGILSNALTFSATEAWGAEFSPNGSKLYLTGWSTQYVYQYDLSTYTQAAINTSQVNLGNVTGPGSPYFTGYLRKAPDNKIYIAVYNDDYLGVVNNPDLAGVACGLVDDGFYLAGRTSSAGLPNVFGYVTLNASYLGPDTTVCSGQSVTLDALNSGFNYLWSTGATTQTVSVNSSGTYWAEVSLNGCVLRDSINVMTISPPPPFSLGNDSAYCGSFSRTLNTGNSSTVWSTGVTAAQITVNSPGTYSASISNVCGTATDTIVFSQTIPFTVNIGNDTTVCTGQTVTFNAGNSGAVFNWSTGANTQTISAGLAGIYWVDVSLNGCTIRDSAGVTTLTAPPAFSLGNDTSYCGSFSRTLNTGNSNTIWSTGVTAAQITVNSPGTYTASISNICGTATDTIIISQTIPFTVNIGNDTTVCIGQTVTIDAGNPGAVFNWSTGAGTQSISVTTAGIYWVDVSQAGCTIRDSVSISTITPPAAFSLGVDTLYCGNFTRVLFTGNSNTVWSTGATAPQISVSAPGTYYATITNACGTQSDTIVIQQQAAPLVNIGPDTTLCANESLILSSPLSTGNFLWNDGSVGASITTTGTGIYWLEVSQAGCSVRDSIIISAASGPQFSLGPDTVLCGNSLTLSVNLSGVQYLWQNNSTDSFYTVTGSGAYSVTVSNSCGSSSDQIQVELHTDACFMAVPTAFTPNNDGVNDIFRGISRCRVANYLLRVYNRWGEMVFESTDVADGWNGVFRNHAQPLGVFVYYMEYFNECENALKKMQGNVTLVR